MERAAEGSLPPVTFASTPFADTIQLVPCSLLLIASTDVRVPTLRPGPDFFNSLGHYVSLVSVTLAS